MELTDEQRARIARNREEALKRAAARLAREKVGNVPSTSNAVRPQPIIKKPVFPTGNYNQQSMIKFVQKNVSDENVQKPTVEIKIKIVTATRVKIEFYPYHSSIVEAIKRVESRSYEPNTRIWTCSIDDIQKCAGFLKQVQEVNVQIDSIPANILHLLQFKPNAAPDNLTTVMDPNLIEQLFPYQKDGVRFALERNGRILLADEMGLGKSVQALTIARYYKSDWPLLIVCPASVKGSWKKQLNRFFPAVQRIFIVDKSSDPLPDVRTSNSVAIMSYEQMVLKHDVLKKEKYMTVIFDESHMLKDVKAKRTRVATDLSKIAQHVILLSGTPALSRPSELFSQIRLVDNRLFTNFTDFATRYCDGKQGRFAFEAKGCTNSEELSAIMFKRLMIRRLKVDVLKDLPEKRREIVYVSGPTIDARMDDLQRAKAQYDRMNSTDRSKSHDCLLEFYNLTGIVKAAAVCEHILENYFYPDAPPRKVLIFAHHQIVLDTIQVEVNKRKLKSIRIDGKTPSNKRTALCDSFQNDEEVRVAILSLTAAGIGITLTAASVVVFAEIHFNPGILVQAEDRAHRVGQKDSVFVQYLIAKKTADDVMWNMVQQKLDVLGQVSLSSDTFRTAEKTHLRFADASQPSIVKYFDETPESSFCDEKPTKKQWRDPVQEDGEGDDDNIIVCDEPHAKRGKF